MKEIFTFIDLHFTYILFAFIIAFVIGYSYHSLKIANQQIKSVIKKTSPEIDTLSVKEPLWDDFKKTEHCPACMLLRESKGFGNNQLHLTRISKQNSLSMSFPINFCNVCGKKIEVTSSKEI